MHGWRGKVLRVDLSEDRSRINLWMKGWPEISSVGEVSVFLLCWRNSIPFVTRSGLKTF